ncbi:DUF7882 family protein [Microbacterium sp. K41]|uniref:DUF7882 family protein n=1 Tax=Microbacterium sp. K41 TaxID=2305437 RepID=UPI00406CF363
MGIRLRDNQMHGGSAMVFKYHGSRQPAINRAWAEALAFTANSPGGLYLVPEPADVPVAEPVSS